MKRAEAKAAGERFYMGSPCPRGHDGLRYTSKGTCVGCAKDDAKKKSELRARKTPCAKASSEEMKRKRAAIIRSWRDRNKKAVSEYQKQYRAKNKEKIRAYRSTKKAIRRAIEEAGVDNSVFLLWTQDQPKTCFYCGEDCHSDFHVDHFMPLSRGGAHVLTNLRIACRQCNLRKSARDPAEWIEMVYAQA